MHIENAGTPTVTLITEPFRIPASYRSKSLGHPHLPTVELAHPLASKTPAQVVADTEAILDAVFLALLGGAGA